MKCLLFALAAVPLLASPVRAEDAINEAVQLKYITPQGLESRLRQDTDLRKAVPIAPFSILLQGTPEAVAKAKDVIALLDVPPLVYSLQTRVVRVDVDANGKVKERVLMAPIMSTLEHLAARITVETTSAEVTPVQNRDGTVTLSVEFRQADEPGDIALWASEERRVKPGERVRVIGLIDSPDRTLRKAVKAGNVVRDRGPYTAFYLDITTERIN